MLPPSVTRDKKCSRPPGRAIDENGLWKTSCGTVLFMCGTARSAAQPPPPQARQHGSARYRIDAYQETYFVIDAFQQLFDATEPDFTPLYGELQGLADVPADAALPEDRLVS